MVHLIWKYFRIAFTCLLLGSCVPASKKKSKSSIEVVELKTELFNAVENQSSKPTVSYKEKIWYKDSMAIETVTRFVTNDSNNIRT